MYVITAHTTIMVPGHCCWFSQILGSVLLILLCVTTRLSESANILMLHPIYCGSHEFILRQMGDHLVARGHEVTQVGVMLIYTLYLDGKYI